MSKKWLLMPRESRRELGVRRLSKWVGMSKYTYTLQNTLVERKREGVQVTRTRETGSDRQHGRYRWKGESWMVSESRWNKDSTQGRAPQLETASPSAKPRAQTCCVSRTESRRALGWRWLTKVDEGQIDLCFKASKVTPGKQEDWTGLTSTSRAVFCILLVPINYW